MSDPVKIMDGLLSKIYARAVVAHDGDTCQGAMCDHCAGILHYAAQARLLLNQGEWFDQHLNRQALFFGQMRQGFDRELAAAEEMLGILRAKDRAFDPALELFLQRKATALWLYAPQSIKDRVERWARTQMRRAVERASLDKPTQGTE